MLQKIFLGIIAVSLVVMIVLFTPVFRYYNIEVTNTNLFEEVEEKRSELQGLTEEAIIAQNRIEILSQQLGMYNFDEEANIGLEERIAIALDARTYIYENFEEGVREHLNSTTIDNFSINENLDDYEQRLNDALEGNYLSDINSVVRLMISEYFESIDFLDVQSPTEYSIRYNIYSSFSRTMSFSRHSIEYDFDDYVDLDLARRIHEEGLTVKNLEDLRQSAIYNYIRFLENENLVGWYERIE